MVSNDWILRGMFCHDVCRFRALVVDFGWQQVDDRTKRDDFFIGS